MQNKANFRKSQMNVNLYNTKDYENVLLHRPRKTKPIQTQFKPKTNPISPLFFDKGDVPVFPDGLEAGLFYHSSHLCWGTIIVNFELLNSFIVT